MTRTVKQPIWPAEALPGIRPQFTLKDVLRLPHRYHRETAGGG
ncbi:Alpha-2-macroglobulin [Klebsiella pneumoniae IS53]|nr:Alpha-2-macroglobulin [Klebsiella pneumoniae IS53]